METAKLLLKKAELFERLALSPLARGEHVVQEVMDAAEAFVVSVFAGKIDVRELHKLKAANEQLASLARWFTTNKQPNASAAHMLSRAANEIIGISSFWNRSIMGKKEYANKIKEIFERMQRLHVQVSTIQ